MGRVEERKRRLLERSRMGQQRGEKREEVLQK
jgi:hypothetical protein